MNVARNVIVVAQKLTNVAQKLITDKRYVVTPAGFEPAIYTLKGCRPRPLDDGAVTLSIIPEFGDAVKQGNTVGGWLGPASDCARRRYACSWA